MRYLVTGGCGFIGSHLVDRLVEQGHRVTVVDDLSTGFEANLHPQAVLEKLSILAPVVAGLVKESDGVFHLAAVASTVMCTERWLETHLTNQSGTVALFEAAAKAGVPVVYTSSAAVYGNAVTMPIVEESATLPINGYGVDKLGCEWQARIGTTLKGLQAVGLRLFNVYGPRQRRDSAYAGVISIFAERLSNGEPLVIHGDGMQTRDFIFVQDVVACFDAVMAALREGRALPPVMNVCTGEATSVKKLAEVMRAVWHGASEITHGPARAEDIKFSVGSPARLRRALELPEFHSLEDGLACYAEQRARAA